MMKSTNDTKPTVNILIIGGGFAGAACARKLVHQSGVTVTLVSNSPTMQYYPAVFRAFGTRQRKYSEIPLSDMLPNECSLVIDAVASVDPDSKTITTKSGKTYTGDYLVLCTGMQICYFDIPGISEMALPLRTTHDAIHITNHIDELFAHYYKAEIVEQNSAFRFVIVGGGPAGCEIAGDMLTYAREKAGEYGVDAGRVQVDLIEARDRILGNLSEVASSLVQKRLEKIGVNIRVKSKISEGHGIVAQLEKENIQTRTLIWSAGISPTNVAAKVPGFSYTEKGKIQVTEYMNAVGHNDIYAAGDIAGTERSGLAQTAIHDGEFIARDIRTRIIGKERQKYTLPFIATIVPVERGYGVVEISGKVFSGYIGWVARALADMGYYWSVLPMRHILKRIGGLL
jgi:NADH dehydrogenase